MRNTHERIVALGVAVLLLIPLAASAADQTVEVQVLPANTLSIDVEPAFWLNGVVPGDSTYEHGFGMGITNTTASGWTVTVAGTDLQGFDNAGDGERVPNEHTIPATAIYVRGGDADHGWGPDAIIAYGENFTAANTPFTLMVGTDRAYGQFGWGPGEQESPVVRVDVPALAVETNYYTTLTYTITGS